MKKIYRLEDHSGKVGEATTDFLPGDPHNTSDAPRCEVCGRYVGLLRWEPPYRVELETWGSRYGDMAYGVGEAFLVSDRFKLLWEKEKLVGLEGFKPAEIVKVKRRGKRIKEAPPGYWVVWPVRSRVAVDQVKSGFEWERPPTCDVCREGNMRGYDRIVLEGEPEENIFYPRGLGVVLVDERFKEFCEEHGITNCILTPAEQAGWWPHRKRSGGR